MPGKPKASTGGQSSWESGDGPGQTVKAPPRKLLEGERHQHPCIFPQVHDNYRGDGKTRESVPPTGQLGQDHCKCRAQARLARPSGFSPSPPGAAPSGEGLQASRPCAFLALGRTCGASPCLELNLCAPTAAG